ncbi:MAG: putative lipid II flippase FtsW [bacterium]
MTAGKGRGDRVLSGVVLTLLLLGSVTVFSSSTSMSAAWFGSSTRMIVNHLTKIVFGLVLLVAFSQLDYRVILRHRLTAPLVGVAVLLLAITLIPENPLAVTRKGATRWLHVGFMVIQPAEIAKLALVTYIASILAQGEGRVRDYKRGFVPIVTVLGIFAVLLMMQPNFGNVLSLTLITVTMLFLGGARMTHLMSSGAAAMPVLGVIALQKGHVVRRFTAFLNPDADPMGASFQLHQSLVALGSGGMFGRGIGASRQSDFFLPDCHTDFVFAVLGEELGLLGTVAIVALFGLLVWRGLVIARGARDLFGRYLAVGITAMIGIVAFLNVAVVVGLTPTTGLPLPFLSYGGSAMLVNLAGVGILQSIAARSSGTSGRVRTAIR